MFLYICCVKTTLKTDANESLGLKWSQKEKGFVEKQVFTQQVIEKGIILDICNENQVLVSKYFNAQLL